MYSSRICLAKYSVWPTVYVDDIASSVKTPKRALFEEREDLQEHLSGANKEQSRRRGGGLGPAERCTPRSREKRPLRLSCSCQFCSKESTEETSRRTTKIVTSAHTDSASWYIDCLLVPMTASQTHRRSERPRRRYERGQFVHFFTSNTVNRHLAHVNLHLNEKLHKKNKKRRSTNSTVMTALYTVKVLRSEKTRFARNNVGISIHSGTGHKPVLV